ncbi:MAG TPA: hypothetical protein VIL85_01635 [Thermomicrobiales bacterium]|jgi:uncharacterized membrane protein
MPPDTTTVPPLAFDDTTIINFLIGIFLPMAIAFVRSRYASSRFAALFAFLVCAGVAVLVTIVGKQFFGAWSPSAGENVRLVVLNAVAILMSARSMFARLYQPLGITQALEKVGPQLGATAPSAAPRSAGIP